MVYLGNKPNVRYNEKKQSYGYTMREMKDLSRGKYGYDGPEEFRPITAWGYVGYTLLFIVPVIGLACLLVFTFSSKNIPRRCYARSYWCWLLSCVMIIVLFLFVLPWLIPGFAGYLNLLASCLELLAASVRM